MFSDRPIPRRSLVQATAAAALGLLIAPASASPDTQGPIRPVVIDTDMGVDDAVALALALQSPQISIVSIVACEGAAGRAAAVHNVERLLDAFNRQEIQVFASDLAGSAPPPDIRERAEAMVGAALPETSVWLRLPFAPEAYRSPAGPTTVLALGPLTQLAAALERRPGLASAIERVVVAGDPADRESWNLIRDPEAVRSVRRAGVRLQFVAARGRAAKPEAWHLRGLPESRSTSLADSFLDRLLAQPAAREHYLESLGQLHDELAVLYLLEPQLFEASRSGDVLMPREGVDVGARIAELMRRGRQLKQPVVLSDRSLPDVMLQEDLRARRDAIVAANGEDEWTAELLLNELHEHLGAYSIIGVKMGLRAAELLNAPARDGGGLERPGDPAGELPRRRSDVRDRIDPRARPAPSRARAAGDHPGELRLQPPPRDPAPEGRPPRAHRAPDRRAARAVQPGRPGLLGRRPRVRPRDLAGLAPPRPVRCDHRDHRRSPRGPRGALTRRPVSHSSQFNPETSLCTTCEGPVEPRRTRRTPRRGQTGD